MTSREEYIKAHPECMPHADTGHWEYDGDEFGDDSELYDYCRDYTWDSDYWDGFTDWLEGQLSFQTLLQMVIDREGMDGLSDYECDYIDSLMDWSTPEEGEDFYWEYGDITFTWVWDPLEEDEEDEEPVSQPSPCP